MKYLLLIALLGAFSPLLFCQIEGTIKDSETATPVSGASITTSEQFTTTSTGSGEFSLAVNRFPVTIITSAKGYPNDTTIVFSPTHQLIIALGAVTKTMEAVVITAGRRAQKVEEVTISMEVLKPALINNKGITSLDQAVNQSPGVFAMDGQVGIRGGGGICLWRRQSCIVII